MNSTPIALTPFAKARWLIVAPHPDDEILGAAALISDAHKRGCFAGTVFLTDGSASHTHPDDESRRKLINIRQFEARLAQRRLIGSAAVSPTFFNWPDARPFDNQHDIFVHAAKYLGSLCRQRQVDAIAVTAAYEPHCDHSAASRLVHAAAETAMRPIAIFEYIVWARSAQRSHQVMATPGLARGKRDFALSAHRSQFTCMFGDGFRLCKTQMKSDPRDILHRSRQHAA